MEEGFRDWGARGVGRSKEEGGHSGPGGRRINLSKCMKNQTK